MRLRSRVRVRRRRVFPIFRRVKLWSGFVGGASRARLIRARSGARFGFAKRVHEAFEAADHQREDD